MHAWHNFETKDGEDLQWKDLEDSISLLLSFIHYSSKIKFYMYTEPIEGQINIYSKLNSRQIFD